MHLDPRIFIEMEARVTQADPQQMSLAICTIFRNETPYLREWIEFHRLVGVERFYLYQNLSDDDWQSVLSPYIERGVVELTDWPMPSPCQLMAYRDFIDKHKADADWGAFIDCDEFLFPTSHGTLNEAMAELPLAWDAVGVNWICFGASGREVKSNEPVIERFTLRAADDFAPNRHIKSIVRLDRVESVGHDPHHFRTGGGTFSELGDRIADSFTAKPSHRLLRINHYLTKSRQEFLERIAKGRADLKSSRQAAEFDQYQSDRVDDRCIWRFLPELKVRLAADSSFSG